jgi:hypothetical protein
VLPERLECRCDLEGLLVASSGFRAGLVLGRPSKSECGIMTSRALTDLTDSGVLGVDHAVPVKKTPRPGVVASPSDPLDGAPADE